MHNFQVGFNDDGKLILESVVASWIQEAQEKAQPLHPDLPIVLVKWVK